VGIALAREECRVRPKLGRVGERNKGRERERGGMLDGMWPASDHGCWLDETGQEAGPDPPEPRRVKRRVRQEGEAGG